MDPYYWGPHFFGWMWIFPLTFLIICLVFLFLFLFRGPRWFMGQWDHHAPRETAREILDRRYTGGEITKEQYEEIKRSLEGG